MGALLDAFSPTKASQTMKILKFTLFPIIVLISLFGNTLTIFFTVKYPRFRTPVKPLTLNISISNLVISILPAIFYILEVAMGRWVLGEYVCKLTIILEYSALCSSNLTLVLIAYERYKSVKMPLRWRLRTSQTNIYLLCITWVLALAICIGFSKVENNYVLTEEGYFCSTAWIFPPSEKTIGRDYFIAIFTLFHVIPSLAIIVLYVKLGKLILQRDHNCSQNQAVRQRNQEQRSHTVKTLAVIVVIFQLCWLPSYIQELFLMLQVEDSLAPETVHLLNFIVVSLGYSHSAIHPLIYPISSGHYRECYIQFFQSICCCMKKSRVLPSGSINEANGAATVAISTEQ